MFAVGVTARIDDNMLSQLSSEPGEAGRNYFQGVSFMDVNQFADDIQAGACNFSEVHLLLEI